MRSKCDENHKFTKQSYYWPLIKQANTNMSHNIKEKKIIFADKHVLSLSHMSIFEMILFFQCNVNDKIEFLKYCNTSSLLLRLLAMQPGNATFVA